MNSIGAALSHPAFLDPGQSDADISLCPAARAARDGDLAALRFLALHGAPIDQPDSNGSTPLMWAAASGHADCVQALLGAGAHHGARDLARMTAAAYACYSDHPACLSLLIEAGADLHSRVSAGDITLLLLALNLPSEECAALLIERRAGIDEVNSSGSTPLLMAARDGSAPIVKLLLDAGANPRLANNSGLTALFIAAKRGYAPCALAIALAGGDLEARHPPQEHTATQAARAGGHDELAEALHSIALARMEKRQLLAHAPDVDASLGPTRL